MRRLIPYRLRLVSPLVLPGGIRLDRREGMLIHDPETGGWGDAAPLPGFSRETLEEVRRAAADPEADRAHLPSLQFAEACLSEPFSAPDTPVEVNALWFADRESPAAMAARLGGWSRPVVKVKPGPDPVPALWRDLLEQVPGLRFRIDPNRSWTVEQALRILDALPEDAVEYVEEPLSDPAEYPELWRRGPAPVALDESLRSPEGGDLALAPEVVALVLKPTLLGHTSFEWREFARIHGKPVVWSSSFESGVGLWHLARLAEGGVPAGLDTADRLAEDVVSPRPLSRQGRVGTGSPLSIRPLDDRVFL